jgi:hypothetical protein
MPTTPIFGRQRQGEDEFEASLGYLIKLCLKKQNTTKRKITTKNPKTQ